MKTSIHLAQNEATAINRRRSHVGGTCGRNSPTTQDIRSAAVKDVLRFAEPARKLRRNPAHFRATLSRDVQQTARTSAQSRSRFG